ncbi:MAG: type II toxin-antitoxin system Phd/YefM family antitoxin [Thiobacillus sp.]|nr:type II toxin-antitoxin system Phd/YefM family antitoxin [Thiobacillus sp.]
MTKASIAEAKNHFPRLVQQAEAGEQISITRRGHPVAVLLSTQTYERLIAPKPALREFLHTWREEMRTASISLADEDVFTNLRDNTAGRGVELG